MIRADLKKQLENKDLDKIFLQHRDNIDPGNYRVGKIGEEVVAWNPDTNEIMDYFFDDSKEEWFCLSMINKNLNKYSINRKGEVKNQKKLLKKVEHESYLCYFPSYTINKKRKNVILYIHRVLAMMFIPNIDPKNKVDVDHIDRDRHNLSLINLRWVTKKESAENKEQPRWHGEYSYIAYKDKEKTQLIFKLNEEEFLKKGFKKRPLSSAIKNNYRSQGYYWTRVNIQLVEYLKKFNMQEQDIDDTKWKLHYSRTCWVHPLGLVKKTKHSPIISLGSLEKKRKDYHPVRRYNGKLVHILVAEVFLNNNKPIPKKYEVDHKSGDSLNNRASNLEICTHSKNMNNPNTREKFYKKIIDLETGTVYKSVGECANVSKIHRVTVYRYLKKGIRFKYYEEN